MLSAVTVQRGRAFTDEEEEKTDEFLNLPLNRPSLFQEKVTETLLQCPQDTSTNLSEVKLTALTNTNPMHANTNEPITKKQTDSFVRQSTKYWAHSVDIPALCATIANNIDVHVVGESDTPWTPISSVYLDNMNRTCYTDRIRKDEGARIVRLRTYNRNTNSIFVERKVHHEKWSGEISSKDRFVIRNDQVMQLLRGQKPEVSPKNVALRDEIQDMVTEKQIFPVVRVNYDRIAFQSHDSDFVRVTVDLSMKLLQERASHMEWCTPEEHFLVQDQILFPYAVVEIKLREPYISNPPKWLSDLENSTLMHKENNFSKYLHAVYAFQVLEGNKLSLVEPVWWQKMMIVSHQMPVQTADPSMLIGKSSREQKYSASAKNVGTSAFGFSFPMLAMFSKADGAQVGVAKVDPKTLFAAERTFLSWFSASLFIASFGVAIVVDSTNNGGKAQGTAMIGCGIAFIFYAMHNYIKRCNALMRKQSAGYLDLWGPVILGMVTLGVFGTAIFF